MRVRTDGTLIGVGCALHKANVPARVVAVEPDGSAVMSGDAPGRHGIQGLADVFIPDLIKLDEIDQIVRISTADAVAAAENLAREEGLLVGISSGANVLAATRVARELGPGNTIVTGPPDRGERYLSLTYRCAGCYPEVNRIRMPAAITEPITPATFGPIACISKIFCGFASRPTLLATRAAIGTADTPAAPIRGLIG